MESHSAEYCNTKVSMYMLHVSSQIVVSVIIMLLPMIITSIIHIFISLQESDIIK